MTDTDEPEDTPIETELDAMRQLVFALEPLDRQSRDRVLSWAIRRYPS